MTTNEVLADTSGIGEIRDPYLERYARDSDGYYDRGETSIDAPEGMVFMADSYAVSFGGLKRAVSSLRAGFAERVDSGVNWLEERQRTRQTAKALGVVVTAGATAVIARKVASSS